MVCDGIISCEVVFLLVMFNDALPNQSVLIRHFFFQLSKHFTLQQCNLSGILAGNQFVFSNILLCFNRCALTYFRDEILQTFIRIKTFYVGLVKKTRQSFFFSQIMKSCSLVYFSRALVTAAKSSLESV